MKILISYLFFLFFSFAGHLHAQTPSTDKIIIEFMKPGDKDAEARDYNLLPWPEEAKAAAYKAAEIWASYLEITVPIRVKFGWCDNIEPQAQGGATYSALYSDSYYYPYSLINQLLGYDKNTNSVDIICVFKSTINWYFGLEEKQQWYPDSIDPTISYSKNSIIPTMLHEICHGLGIDGGSFSCKNEIGKWGGVISGSADIFDCFIGDISGNQLINSAVYPNNSTKLKTALTSEAIYWLGKNAIKANNYNSIKIHAPKIWKSGNSIAHTATEYGRTINDLMSNGKAGVISNNGTDNLYTFTPGPIVLGMLQDIGWTLKENPTSNEDIKFDSSVRLFTAGNQIVIEGAKAGQQVIVADFSGRVVYTGKTNEGTKTINLASGIYVLRVGKESFKIKL